jgi:hypothetical protein
MPCTPGRESTQHMTGNDRHPRTWAWLVVLLAIAGGCHDAPPTAPSSPTLLTASFNDCDYKLSTASVPASIPAGGGTFTLQLTTSSWCGWSAAIPEKLSRFVELSPAQGVGSTTILVTVRAHTGIQNRTIQATIVTMTVSTVQSAAPAPVAGPNAVLVYSGTTEESLSYGQAGVVTTDAYNVTASTVNSSTTVADFWFRSLAPAPQPWPWNFNVLMDAPTGNRLAAGFYGDAVGWTGAPMARNQLSVAVASLTCSDFEGQFEIFDISQASDGRVLRFHGKVVQRCLRDQPGTSLTLEVWYPSRASF